MQRRKFANKWLVYYLEAGGAVFLYSLFRVLPIAIASWLGGMLLCLVGPRLKISQVARRNLKTVFPDKNIHEIEKIVRRMWDNLGRTVGELPHIATLVTDQKHVLIDRPDIIDSMRDDGQPGIIFSAHIGNWELGTLPSLCHGLSLSVFYRTLNNPIVERLYRRIHGAIGTSLLAKGSQGARKAMEILGQGGHVGILVDQRMNNGILIPFLGRNAMTAPALAHFAYRYSCPVVPSRVVRLCGIQFKFVVEPPLDLPRTGNFQEDVAETMRRVNACIEKWILDTPEQWLWIHNRWPEEKLIRRDDSYDF